MAELTYTLITGASSGIGKAIAWYCGSLRMNLLLVSLPGEKLDEVATQIAEKYKVFTSFYETDLTNADAPEAVFNWTNLNGFDVNILVNDAGVAGASVFETCDLKYIDDRILLNIRALVMLSRLYIPALKIHENSYILNVGSMSAFFSIPYKSLYSSSKAFVLNFSRALATELKDTGISISVLCPNGVITNSTTSVRVNSHGKFGHITALSAEKVARIGVDGMLKRKFLIIPGRINHVLLVLRNVIPVTLQQKILRREFMKEVRATVKL